MFETDSIPLDWAARCEKMDAIWVPTRFHQDAFQRAGVSADKLFVRVAWPVAAPFKKRRTSVRYRL